MRLCRSLAASQRTIEGTGVLRVVSLAGYHGVDRADGTFRVYDDPPPNEPSLLGTLASCHCFGLSLENENN